LSPVSSNNIFIINGYWKNKATTILGTKTVANGYHAHCPIQRQSSILSSIDHLDIMLARTTMGNRVVLVTNKVSTYL